MAAEASARLVDTDPVHNEGRAHRALAPVLAAHSGLRVATKIGHMTPEQALRARRAGVLSAVDAARCHSIEPAYVDYQLSVNGCELRRDCLDLVYLHNPERAADDNGPLAEHLALAFEVLECAARRGQIGGYGVATWDGFSSDGLCAGAFSVTEVVWAAEWAAEGGTSHLVAIQMPLNLARLAAVDGRGPVAEAAAAGLQVWASAPHGDELVSPGLVEMIRPGLSPAGAALLVTCSTPGLTGVLVSTGDPAHWAEAEAVAAMPPLSLAQLREICDVLTPGPDARRRRAVGVQ
ncbi:hypothetical protein GCM10009560_14080 [Nonomuraea longicatena]|uniref:NADP-dependent oxidoreductase domain-containing protein n=2 Tax=Nonomuraea longicatena TaxID=83682 RepID=A0ABP3ZBV5_9ACTN